MSDCASYKPVTGKLINSQDAIDVALTFFVEYLGGAFDENSQKELMARLQRLPSAESERKKGGWIFAVNSPDGKSCYVCKDCGAKLDSIHTNFCGECGADMRGDRQ